MRKPVADRFLKYVDENKATRTREAFAWLCVRQGIADLVDKEISEKIAPLVNQTFDTGNDRVEYQEDEHPDVVAQSLPAKLNIKNKKVMMIEGCFRFMIIKKLMKVGIKAVIIID